MFRMINASSSRSKVNVCVAVVFLHLRDNALSTFEMLLSVRLWLIRPPRTLINSHPEAVFLTNRCQHGNHSGWNFQRRQCVSLHAAWGLSGEFFLLDVRILRQPQCEPRQQLGAGGHVPDHPHHHGGLLGGVCGRIVGQLPRHVRHHQVRL